MRSIALAALLLLALAAPAQASHRMTFDFAQLVAVDYWAKRDVTVPCHPRERVLTYHDLRTSDRSIDMVAEPAICVITVTPWADAWRNDPEFDQDYCREIVHEVGHLAGLEHPDAPRAASLPERLRVMLPHTVMNTERTIPPWGCVHPNQFLRMHRAAVLLARTSRLVPIRSR